MKKSMFYRVFFYVLGLLIMALGITLNTKSGLGVSPIISVSYSVSDIWNFNFGNATFVLYGAFIMIEMVVHLFHHKKVAKDETSPSSRFKMVLLLDLLQLPLSLVFTRFLNLYAGLIPDFQAAYPDSFAGSFWARLIVLLIAIVFTGIGAAMSLDMRLIPNPADGLVQAIADLGGKTLGFIKNCFDGCNILLTAVISLLFAGHLIGIGLGTVLTVIGVGRVIALFNRLAEAKMTSLAQVNKTE